MTDSLWLHMLRLPSSKQKTGASCTGPLQLELQYILLCKCPYNHLLTLTSISIRAAPTIIPHLHLLLDTDHLVHICSNCLMKHPRCHHHSHYHRWTQLDLNQTSFANWPSCLLILGVRTCSTAFCRRHHHCLLFSCVHFHSPTYPLKLSANTSGKTTPSISTCVSTISTPSTCSSPDYHSWVVNPKKALLHMIHYFHNQEISSQAY